MKKLLSFIPLALMVIVSQSAFAQNEVVWPEQEAFHEVMSKTFHPLEEGNYQPIRERANEMADKAEAWKKSDIPAEFTSQKDIKKNLKVLAKESKELAKEIKKGCSDEEIKEEMNELHDIFHTIVGLCAD